MAKKLYLVTAIVNITVEMDDKGFSTPSDFITECEFNFTSKTEGAEIKSTDWIDSDYKEIEET